MLKFHIKTGTEKKGKFSKHSIFEAFYCSHHRTKHNTTNSNPIGMIYFIMSLPS